MSRLILINSIRFSVQDPTPSSLCGPKPWPSFTLYLVGWHCQTPINYQLSTPQIYTVEILSVPHSLHCPDPHPLSTGPFLPQLNLINFLYLVVYTTVGHSSTLFLRCTLLGLPLLHSDPTGLRCQIPLTFCLSKSMLPEPSLTLFHIMVYPAGFSPTLSPPPGLHRGTLTHSLLLLVCPIIRGLSAAQGKVGLAKELQPLGVSYVEFLQLLDQLN